MEQNEFKTKALDAMKGPVSFVKLWNMMEESDSSTIQIKLFRNEGDKKPYRAIILVNGEKDVEEILKYVDGRAKA